MSFRQTEITQKFHFPRNIIVLAVMAFLATGCASIGPNTIKHDQFDYSDAMSQALKDQTLLNVVKLRYADMPMFLEVASVINSYSLEGSLSAGATFSSDLPNVQSLGAGGKYTDKPTITYSPIRGDKFTKSILTPMHPAAIFFLVQSGWPVDFVFRLAVREINSIKNSIGSTTRGQTGSPEFYILMQALRRIQLSGDIGMRMQKNSGRETSLIFFNKSDTAGIQEDVDFVNKTLGLDPDRSEYRLVFGHPQNKNEMGVLTRSLLEILVELAASVQVPPEHLDDKSTIPSHYDLDSEDPRFQPLIKVNSAKEPPADSYAAARYQDYWYWIDRSDFKSKRMFTFTMLLFTLAETGGSQPAPVVTIPAG
jgi:hypothetical protein